MDARGMGERDVDGRLVRARRQMTCSARYCSAKRCDCQIWWAVELEAARTGETAMLQLSRGVLPRSDTIMN